MQHKGFSLIELLVVLALIGFLTTFVYPNYLNSLTRSRRYEGQTALLDLANRMERYYAEHQTYRTATLGTGKVSDISASTNSPQGWYTLAISQQTDSTFSLQAIPQNVQAHDACQILTFNHLGVKQIQAGPKGEPSETIEHCW